jgi:hypothetical protein
MRNSATIRYLLSKECNVGWWSHDVDIITNCLDLQYTTEPIAYESPHVTQLLNEINITDVDIISGRSLTIDVHVVTIRCYHKEDIATIQRSITELDPECCSLEPQLS